MRTRVLGEPLALDWDRTTIYPVSGARGFRVNLKGRENRGIVEPGEAFDSLRREIRDRILEAVDPVSGERVAQRAFFPEQIYHGEHLAWAPDVIIGPNEALGYDFLPGDPRDPRLSVPTPENSGGHRLAGMLLISGQNVRAVEGAPPAEIIDLAPTLMWLLGEPVPPEMDGCVLAEAFDAPLDGDVGRRSDGVQGDGVEANAAQEGRPSVTQRLKDLGYL